MAGNGIYSKDTNWNRSLNRPWKYTNSTSSDAVFPYDMTWENNDTKLFINHVAIWLQVD